MVGGVENGIVVFDSIFYKHNVVGGILKKIYILFKLNYILTLTLLKSILNIIKVGGAR